MGFFKELGSLVGTVTGAVIGGAVSVVGEVTDCDLIKDIGEGVFKTSVAAGNLVGQAADGATGIVGGIIAQDEHAVNKGIEEFGDATGKVIVGTVAGVGNIAKNTLEAVEGVIEGDEQKALEAGKALVKVAAVSALAIGVADYLDIVGTDGVDLVDHDMDMSDVGDLDIDMDDMTDGEHFVEPHYVDSYVRSDGTFVEGFWRDGDGNTNIDLTVDQGGGYMRTNPRG